MIRYGDKQIMGLVDLWSFSTWEWRTKQLLSMHEDDAGKLLKRMKISTATELVESLKKPMKEV